MSTIVAFDSKVVVWLLAVDITVLKKESSQLQNDRMKLFTKISPLRKLNESTFTSQF